MLIEIKLSTSQVVSFLSDFRAEQNVTRVWHLGVCSSERVGNMKTKHSDEPRYTKAGFKILVIVISKEDLDSTSPAKPPFDMTLTI